MKCLRCLLTTDDGVTIGNGGVCNLCEEFDKRKRDDVNVQKILKEYKPERRKELSRLFTKLKARKDRSNYDCLLHLSGGKDSVMVLYELITIYKLRVLAYTHDNGFESAAAKKNAELATNELGVDWIYYKMDNAYWPFYYFLRSDLRMKIDICTFCEFFQEPATDFAFDLMEIHNIPLAVTGSAANANAKQPLLDEDYKMVAEFLKQIEPKLRKHGYDLFKQRSRHMHGQLSNNRETIDYWAEIAQDMDETVRIVKEKLGWVSKNPGGFDTGCDLGYLQKILDEKYPPRRMAYKLIRAQDIRSGHASPEFYNALPSYKYSNSAHVIDECTKKILDRFNLSRDDL